MAASSEVREKKRTWRAGIGTMLSVLIFVVGAYYFIRVQQKTAYFGQRNLRVLSTVATQLGDRIRPPAAEVGRPPAILEWHPNEGTFHVVFRKADGAGDEKGEVHGSDKLVEPVLSQSFLDVFDTMILADDKGNVRWQRPGSPSSMAQLDALRELRGFGKEDGTITTADLQRRAFNTRVTLEGRQFRLFSQPVQLPELARAGDGSASQPWIVAGFVSRGRFASDTGAVSYTLLIMFMAAFLLIIFSLPFLKLGLLGELQRVRVTDVILLGVALLCALSVLTIILLDAVAYRRTRAASDAQLRRLASDIKRHVRDEVRLASAVLTRLDETLPAGAAGGESEPLPDALRQDPVIRAYPFFESFVRIDEHGAQRQKWVFDTAKLRKISVADRDYFRDALHGRTWGKTEEHPPYTLQAIRSWTGSGVTQAVIARRVEARPPWPGNAVVALAFPMLSLIDTVVAGDCDFAVIDDSGKVMFHSESQRNEVENFFVETDNDRALRAAVAGRQNEMLNVRYWGEDQRAFATPLDGTPWTLVTFRSKRLLRTLNVETIMITVMFLLIHALGYALFAALVAVARPSYRAPWLWPDRDRGGDYICLIASYIALSIAFGASIYLFRPTVVLVVASSLPALALLLTYARLRRDGVFGKRAALLGVACASAVLLVCVVRGQAETDILPPELAVRFFIVLNAAMGVFAGLVPLRKSESSTIMPGYSYVVGATGLLVLSAVLPTAALYKAAYTIEMESFVKHGQLELVRDIEDRFRHIETTRAVPGRPADVTERLKQSSLGIYHRFFCDTEVFLAPTVADARHGFDLRQELARHSAADLSAVLPWKVEADEETFDPNADFMTTIAGAAAPLDSPNPVPRFVEWLLPQYSDHSIRMRELLHSESADKQWTWRRRRDYLDFRGNSVGGLQLVTASAMPRLLPRSLIGTPATPLPLRRLFDADRPDYSDVLWESDAVTRAGRLVLILAGLAAYLSVLVLTAHFIARKVFLVDLRDPLWLDPNVRVGPALGGNMLIFAPDTNSALETVDRRAFVHVTLASWQAEDGPLDEAALEEVWNREITRIDSEAPGKGILIRDFGLRAGDAQLMKLKLRLLERAAPRNVIAITTVSPWALLDTVSRTADAERWRAALSTFRIRVIEPPMRRPPELENARWETAVARIAQINGSRAQALAIIARETESGGDFLRQLRAELTQYDLRGREEIYDEIGERAAAYYAGLWATCTNEEKAVLVHISADGFGNSKDRHTIRRLLARGLVRRAPNFEVMNETFRRFVLADPRHREVKAFVQNELPESAWDKIQKPLMISLVVGGGLFFFTQRELFDASFAVISGVAGGIPAVLKIVGIFTAPRDAIAAARP